MKVFNNIIENYEKEEFAEQGQYFSKFHFKLRKQ